MNFLLKSVLLFFLLELTSCSGNANRVGGHLADNPTSELQLITIYKPDKSIQCESKGIDLDVMKNELTFAGVEVVCAKKGDTGLVVIAKCGASTTRINIYSIQASDWMRAKKLGFKRIDEIANYTGHDCEK